MQAVRVKYQDRQKYICYEGQLTFKSFLECVSKKFEIPTLDLKVYDDLNTEVDEDAFAFLVMKPDLGVLEVCLPKASDFGDSVSPSTSHSIASSSSSSFLSSGAENEGESDDTTILQPSPAQRNRDDLARLAQIIEKILREKPGGERILTEYADSRRRDMVKILVAHMASEHGTSPSRRVKEDYAKGITALFPYLADPQGTLGYEQYYNPVDGSGFLAWRVKTLQKEASEGQKKRNRQPMTGGPDSGDRTPFSEENQLTTETQCCEAIALMQHTTDEAIIKEKMKQTFTHRQTMVHDPVKSSEVFTTFPRFLDITGMIEQDFSLMFGDDISAKFLEKWPTHYRQKVLEQSRGLTQTSDLEDLLHNAESTTEELEDGWDSEMSSILLLIHLMPPSPHGRNKRPGKLSARQAIDHLVKFIKTGTSVEGHLDSITESRQPYLLAVGTQRSTIHKYFIVIDKHAIPCRSPDSLASFDELFKAHFVFATSYNRDLANVYHFLQTAVYQIDASTTKVNPRVKEMRARMLN
ncbi:uncharacterized protein LOC143332212 [Chaetodon auriga]|uniref:uncharacterized protein LOC143332212 n=1 Tax=Chaetodon auriga TaxID=39042 RepID=UPI004032EE40